MSDHKRGICNTVGRKTLRKELRNSATAAEAVLWTYLKESQLDGKKFRRQSGVGPYIVDFFARKVA
jgi:very-short-patch-repair endonuclease